MVLRIRTTLSIFIALIAFLIISTWVFSSFAIRQLKDNVAVQVHSRAIILALKDNLILLIDAETGERGYAITGDSSYLEPYKKALQKIPASISLLGELTVDDSLERLHLASLLHYTNLKLDYIKEITDLKSSGNDAAIKTELATKRGKMYMDAVRTENAAMLAEEEQLFRQHSAETDKSISQARNVFIAEALISLFATLYLAYNMMRELQRRIRTERAMQVTNLELERKNKEIEQFAYIASHDLQEPLRSIDNFSRLLDARLHAGSDSDAKAYIGYISRSAHRMSRLIFDLLEYSRVGKEVSKSPVDCNILISEVIESLSAIVADSGAEIIVGELPIVQGYGYLKSVFQNLIGNALKFRKPDIKPIVQISSADKGSEYQFAIKDNGIGIDPEYFERIFRIFQRLHGRAQYEGTGIGLSQCKKIVELHGGRIWVESVPGEGSSFYFTIPKT